MEESKTVSAENKNEDVIPGNNNIASETKIITQKEEMHKVAGPNKKSKKEKPKKVKKQLSREEKFQLKLQKKNKKYAKKRILIDFESLDATRSEKKKRYSYLVADDIGNVIKGRFDAYSKVDVHSFLLSQGYEVYNIEEDKFSNLLGVAQSSSNKKMKARQLEFFLTQLSTYIKAGITLVDAIVILSKQTTKRDEKLLYQKLIYELNAGHSFSESLAKQGNAFPKLLINMVKTAELTGQLTDVLDDMTDYYRSIDATRKQVISAMTYPSVIFILSLIIVTFIILWVVPQFVDIYSQAGANMPWITLTIINLSLFLQSNIIILIIIIIAAIIAIITLYKNVRAVRYILQTILLHIPVVKSIIIDKEIILFTKTFASLTEHDVFITASMEILSQITNNEIYKMLIADAIVNLQNGEEISKAFKNHWAFPTTAYEMMVTGERTGRMGPMMRTVANYYQDHQKVLVTQLKSLIEPIMIIFLAAIVGVILLSIVIPMFDIYGHIG